MRKVNESGKGLSFASLHMTVLISLLGTMAEPEKKQGKWLRMKGKNKKIWID